MAPLTPRAIKVPKGRDLVLQKQVRPALYVLHQISRLRSYALSVATPGLPPSIGPFHDPAMREARTATGEGGGRGMTLPGPKSPAIVGQSGVGPAWVPGEKGAKVAPMGGRDER